MTDIVQNSLLWACAAAMAVIVGVALVALLRAVLRVLRRALEPRAMVALAVAAVVATIWARKGGISFPRTDPDIAYLTDAGSSVGADVVHVAYTRFPAVPLGEHIFVDCRPVDSEDDADWLNVVNSTFAEFPSPQDVSFNNATNYDWMVYTTWTQGPAVQTNGVWHAVWGVDRNGHGYLIPVKTCVRIDGDVIATPKSREDNHENQ